MATAREIQFELDYLTRLCRDLEAELEDMPQHDPDRKQVEASLRQVRNQAERLRHSLKSVRKGIDAIGVY